MGQACNVTLIMSGTDGRVLQVLRSPLRQQYNLGVPRAPFYTNPPIAADLDGDGSVEIISGADVWRRVAGSWTLAWQGSAEPAQVAVADLDGDGRQEVIWALDRSFVLAEGTPYVGFIGIVIFDANGQELRRIPLPNRFPGMMTVADIDGDRTPDPDHRGRHPACDRCRWILQMVLPRAGQSALPPSAWIPHLLPQQHRGL